MRFSRKRNPTNLSFIFIIGICLILTHIYDVSNLDTFYPSNKENVIKFPLSSNNDPLWYHTATDSIEAVAISADGDYIVSEGRDNDLYLTIVEGYQGIFGAPWDFLIIAAIIISLFTGMFFANKRYSLFRKLQTKINSFKKIRRRYKYLISILLILFLSIFIISIINLSNVSELEPPPSGIPHNPIYIDGNMAFANISSIEGWGGNGTIDNPYIIEDYFIEDFPIHGIEIRNTDVFFIISNISIKGGTEFGDFQNGIDLYNVKNGLLIGNIVSDKDNGYFLENSDNISLIENIANEIDYDCFHLENCHNNNLTNNIVSDGGYFSCGFFLESADNNILMENIAMRMDDECFSLKGSNWNILVANSINNKDRGDNGIYIWSNSNYNLITSNVIKHIDCAIKLSASDNNNVTGNVIEHINCGIDLYSSDYNIISKNTITQFWFDCTVELFCEGNLISENECQSAWINVGIVFSIILLIIVLGVYMYRTKPMFKLRKKKYQRNRKKDLEAKNFETLLRDSKRLINQGNQAFLKKNYEEAIEKWKKSVDKYKIASKDVSLVSEKTAFNENINTINEQIYKAYIESAKAHNLTAKNAHEKENISKARREWNLAIDYFQVGRTLAKSEKLDLDSSLIKDKIKSIRLNLNQLDIEQMCLEANNKIASAQSLQNKDLIQATKITQDSFILYSKAKKEADKYPEFKQLVKIILSKLESTRNFQSSLQDKMEDLIGITSLATKVSIKDDTIKKSDNLDTIIKPEAKEEGLSIIREYEFIGGQIRFKTAIKNNTRSSLTNFKISFDLPDALKWTIHQPNYERKGDSLHISKIGVGEKKTVSLYLEPINCLTSPINATISFLDARDRPQAFPMEPKMVTITCPLFFTKEDANLARVKHTQRSLNHQDKKIFPIKNLEKAELIFNSIIAVLGKYDIKLIFIEYSDDRIIGEAWFYGVTKIKKNKLIIYVSLNGKRKVLELEVSGDSEEQITAFLAEIGNGIRQELLINNVINYEDEFYDMNISIVSHTCPYCGEPIQKELVNQYLSGIPIQCKYCNVKLFYSGKKKKHNEK